MAENCSISSIYSGIYQRLVDSPSNLYQNGLSIGIGTPSQSTALWPSITNNETSLWSTYSCVARSSQQCMMTIDDAESMTTTSSTWLDNPSYSSLDNAKLYNNASANYGTDTLEVWTYSSDSVRKAGPSVQGFPVTLLSNHTSTGNDIGSGGFLGLGSGSTVLDKLYKQKLIASKSYGLYVGTDAPRASGTQNGSLVLGGYDAAGFSGPVHTYTQVPASVTNDFSPFQLRIAQMSLDIAPDQSVNLTEQGGFDAYLTTQQYPIQLPRSVTQRLASSFSATPANNSDNTFALPNGFGGNLTIMLDDGFKVTFDSTWLSNASNISPISVTPRQNTNFSDVNSNTSQTLLDDSPVLLGIAFLQQVYLMVSYDSSPATFSLAQANTHGKYVQQQSLCLGINPQPAPPFDISPFVQQGLIGAVLAGVIGGIVLISLLALVLRFRLGGWLGRRHATSTDIESKRKNRRANYRPNSTMAKLQQSKSVGFLLKDYRPRISPPVEKPKDTMVRSDSTSSLSSSSTKVSASSTATTEGEDVEKASCPNTQGVTSFNFDFNSNSSPPHQVCKQIHSPPGHPPITHPDWRSSSIYSSD